MTPADLDDVCGRLLRAQHRLAALPTTEIIGAIDRVARRLQKPHEPERITVLESLQHVSRFSAGMAEHLLDRVCEDWKAPALQRLLRAEFGDVDPLTGFNARDDGSRTRAVAPPLGLHIFSGNVPGVGVTSVIRALLVRSAVLGKPAAGEPALGPAFARMLRDEHEAVGAAVEILYWKGGDIALEDVALRHASLVVHYGSEESIRRLRTRARPHVIFVEHGPRISCAVVDARRAAPDDMRTIAAHTAEAVALFDQQGCVSPQIAWVIGSPDQAAAFAAAVSDELGRLERELPRGPITAGEAAAIRELRTHAEFASAGTAVWGPDDLRWSVLLAGGTAMEGSCLNRTLIVKTAPDEASVIAALQPFRAVLQTVGLAGFDAHAIPSFAEDLAAAGVTRITPVRDMPWPPPWWHHDGRGPLRELVRWVDLEG
jgi:hypothetical protein